MTPQKKRILHRLNVNIGKRRRRGDTGTMSRKRPPDLPPQGVRKRFRALRELDPADPLDNAVKIVSVV